MIDSENLRVLTGRLEGRIFYVHLCFLKVKTGRVFKTRYKMINLLQKTFFKNTKKGKIVKSYIMHFFTKSWLSTFFDILFARYYISQ